MIRMHDEQQLIWFFGEGQSLEAGSMTGVMLQSQEVMAVGSGRCRRCHGTGFRGGNPTDLIEAARHRVGDPDASCDRCGGSGRVMVRHASSGASSGCTTLACRRCRGATGHVDCPQCGGAGYTAVGRAAPTTPLPPDREAQMPCGRLQSRFADLSRRVYRVGRHARTLAIYYGDPGTVWESRGGRVLALYPVTTAGRELLARGGDLAEILQLERVRPVPGRSRALRAADREARQLYRAAAERWCDAA